MKRFVATFGIICAILAVPGRQAAAQGPSIQAELLKDWTGLKDTLDKIANAMPEDKFTYKSTPAQRDYGQQILHIAQVNDGLLKLLGAKAAAPTFDAKATSKAAIIKQMDDSFDYGIAAIKEQTDQTMMQAVMNAPGFMGPSSRTRVVYFLIGHTWDIYGQMAVYLRLNGGVPPASQRP